jgi:molybdopterin molybdotransferase
MVTPRVVGLLTAAGPPTVRVTPRPRLAIVTTGSELVGPDERPGSGRIRDSNASMLQSLTAAVGFPARVYARVPDARDALLGAVAAAARGADLVVTSGGVSVGDYDWVPNVVEALRGEILFHRVAIRPGKPTLVGKLGPTWVVGLPGNPLSALVGWHLFVRPLADRLAGDAPVLSQESTVAVLVGSAANEGDRTTFAPAVLTESAGDSHIQLLSWKGSHDLYAASRANVMAILMPGLKAATGERIPFFRL